MSSGTGDSQNINFPVADRKSFVNRIGANPIDLEKCPWCGVDYPNIDAKGAFFETDNRMTGEKMIWRTFACKRCGGVLLTRARTQNSIIDLYLPNRKPPSVKLADLPEGRVRDDYAEALTCYEHECWHAFGTMMRRCLLSVSKDLGTDGQTTLERQIEASLALIDEQYATAHGMKEAVKALAKTGHSGAHPELPDIDQNRAVAAIAFLNDVLDMLYLRGKRAQALIAETNVAEHGAKNQQGKA